MSKETVGVFHSDGYLIQHPAPLPAGMAMHLRYYCRHLPTGEVYPRESYFLNRYAFEFCLKHWSRSDTWLYAETEEEVNMPVDGTLLARGIAAHMAARLPEDLREIKLEHKEAGRLLFTLTVRRCGRMIDGKPVLTGGAEVYVLLRNARYTPWAMEGKSYKLAPGWDDGQLKLAITKAYQWAKAGLVRMAAAEALWDDAQRLSGRPGFDHAVMMREKEIGESRSYREMTLAEIADWHAWLKQWEQENPPRD